MRSRDEKIELEQGRAAGVANMREALRRRGQITGEDHRELLEGLGEIEFEHLHKAHRLEDRKSAEPREARERTAAAADLAARDVRLMRDKLEDVRDGAVARASKKLLDSGGRLSDQDFEVFMRSSKQAAAADGLSAALADLEERHKGTVARVTSEPGSYDAGSPHSWVRDQLAVANPLEEDASAFNRLTRHSQDVAREIRKGTEYGRTAARMVVERHRSDDKVDNERRAQAELRALATGGGATASAASGGAAFVPPQVLAASWATYRSPHASFCDQLNHSLTMPKYGMELYIPVVSATTSVTTQTEGSGVSEADPATTFVPGAIVTKAGQVTVSQQTLDRVGPGITGDVLIWQQIKDQLAASVGSYAIAQALANAQSVSNAGAFALATASGVGGFLGDLRKAKNLLHDTAGVRLRGTHCFAVGDFCDYLAAYADAQGRPIFEPALDDNRLPLRSVGDPEGEGYTGYIVSGLALFADDNVPAASGDLQIIVCRPDTILQLEAEPIPYVMAEGSLAGNLEAIVGVRQYVATVPRYPTGVSVISGAAYTATTFA